MNSKQPRFAQRPRGIFSSRFGRLTCFGIFLVFLAFTFYSSDSIQTKASDAYEKSQALLKSQIAHLTGSDAPKPDTYTVRLGEGQSDSHSAATHPTSSHDTKPDSYSVRVGDSSKPSDHAPASESPATHPSSAAEEEFSSVTSVAAVSTATKAADSHSADSQATSAVADGKHSEDKAASHTAVPSDAVESQVATPAEADTKHTDAKVATSSRVTESPATTTKSADSIELHTLDLDASLDQLEKELASLDSQTETSHVEGAAHTSSAAAEDIDSETYFDEELDHVDAKPSHSSHSG